MVRRFTLLTLLLAACATTVWLIHYAAAAPRQTLTVFAGAAGKPALQQLAQRYRNRTGIQVDVTYGGSGAVLTQFAQEHYGDLYIPGSDDFMGKAERKGAVLKGSRTVLVYLVPTICVPRGNPMRIAKLQDLARPGLRVVVGEPKSVCLGDVAQTILQQQGLWDRVKPQIASYASSCENVLQTLLLGEADVVIGWDVFARQHPDKVQAIALPAKLARPRNIPAAVIKWSQQPDAAKAFIRFLANAESRQVWAKHGYALRAPGAIPAQGGGRSASRGGG
jgi:molybdate transport system substrate-binding protein